MIADDAFWLHNLSYTHASAALQGNATHWVELSLGGNPIEEIGPKILDGINRNREARQGGWANPRAVLEAHPIWEKGLGYIPNR